MNAATPLFLPQLGTLYGAVAPAAMALVRAIVGLALVPHALRFCFGLFPQSGSRILSIELMTGALERSGYRPGRFWAIAIAVTELAAAPCWRSGSSPGRWRS